MRTAWTVAALAAAVLWPGRMAHAQPPSFWWDTPARLLENHLPATLTAAGLLAVLGLIAFHLAVVNTRRTRQAAALRATKARLQAVLAAMPDAAFVLDDSGRVVEVLNDASTLFTLPASVSPPPGAPLGQGRFLEELLPLPCARLLSGAARAAMGISTGADAVQEVVFSLRGAWFEARVAPLRHAPNGGRDEAVCVIRDITTRKELQRSLQAATREAEAMNVRLKELDQLKTELLSAVSQEIRTPLTSVFGFVVLVRKELQRRLLPVIREAATRRPPGDAAAIDAAASRILDNLRIVQEEGARLGRLVDDLLDLSNIEAGKSEWRDEVITLAGVVEKSVASLASQIADRTRVTLQVDLAPTLPPLLMDRDRLQQVVVHLLDNALKVTEEGPVRIIGRLTETGAVELAVEDAGPGIPAADLHRIFEKFQHAPGDEGIRRAHKGSGLGLAICRNIVRHYGGDIRAVSPPGPGRTGARFVVRLPPAPMVAEGGSRQ
ncbi:putative multi-sensor signal transduction histidine kinase [Megalodesulfovibrio gigas DSM 1382 = ATCC 19364]|uniref:histidine kinase n=2 Tax=Megalodesulfovibrio gigas TaxID=879 RepID=T2GFA6_MEGG1|nr:putative multi-sensor signal transduction histidine kinase [Megalodesulfovibrio gigas DSM 1382 = ATCC 19364]